jgi:hypothetical protein
MNPNSGENTNFELQNQPAETELTPGSGLERTAQTPENRPALQKPAVSSQDVSSIAVPSQVTAQTFSDDQTGDGASASASPANHADRIEKQWVDRAKAVIAQTKNDPYRQKAEISKVKAEYIKKRFNKTIKTDDAVAK